MSTQLCEALRDRRLVVDGLWHTAPRPASTLEVLRRRFLWWLSYRELRIVLREIRSLFHRIALERRIAGYLHFEEVYRSVPRLEALCDGSGNQTEQHSYIEGIQALSKERPWMTLADTELFLQGWFQAEKCAMGKCCK